MNISLYILKFFICVIACEINNLKKNISYVYYLFLNVNLIKYLFYIFNNNINPIKSKKFKKFLYLNKIKWKKLDNKSKNNKSKILVESLINQQSCAINNMLIGKHLEILTDSKCIGLLRAGDIKGQLLFKSFGIEKFYIYKFGGFFTRLKYIIKSLKILRNIKNVKDLYNFKINKIEIGLLTYDTWIRYTRIPSAKKINIKLILFFSQALHASDYFDQLVKDTKITKIVQAEKQFIPLNIFFQKSLLKKISIYARNGTDKITVRIYSHFNQRHEAKIKFSKKFLSILYKNKKNVAIKSINKWFKFQIKNKFYGRTWAGYVSNKKNVLSIWKNKADGLEESKIFSSKKVLKISNLKKISKIDLCKNFSWDKNKKIATIFLPYMIDGVYQNGRRNLFLDNYSWIIQTLKIIQNFKNVNWLVKEHPQEIRYNTRSDYPLILSQILKKNSHIKECPINIDPASIKKLTDVCLTLNGTAGLEYQSFGIPSIISERSYYSHFGFSNTPKNIFEYKSLLKKIHMIKKPSNKQINKAKIILYAQYILSLTYSNFLPDNLPQFESRMNLKYEEDFWSRLIKKNNKFNFENDPFKKMFENQILLKNRHTINFNKFRTKSKKINDYFN